MAWLRLVEAGSSLYRIRPNVRAADRAGNVDADGVDGTVSMGGAGRGGGEGGRDTSPGSKFWGTSPRKLDP